MNTNDKPGSEYHSVMLTERDIIDLLSGANINGKARKFSWGSAEAIHYYRWHTDLVDRLEKRLEEIRANHNNKPGEQKQWTQKSQT